MPEQRVEADPSNESNKAGRGGSLTKIVIRRWRTVWGPVVGPKKITMLDIA